MNNLIQKFSETAPEVWNQLVERTIFIAWFGVGFSTLLFALAAVLIVAAKKGVFYDETDVIVAVAALLSIFGLICLAYSVVDLLYPLAGAAKALIDH